MTNVPWRCQVWLPIAMLFVLACSRESAAQPPAEVPTAEVPTAEVPTAEVPTAEVPTAEVPTAEVPRAVEETGDVSSPPSKFRFEYEVRDLIDGAAPVDAKLAKLLVQAESLLAEKKWDRAQEVLLFTLDRADDAIVAQRDEHGLRLIPVAEAANRLIGELPDSHLQIYRQRYGPAAEKSLNAAIASGDRKSLQQIAVQFRHTDAGREAIRRIAAMHFDRSQFGLAAIRYGQLSDEQMPVAARVRAAFANAASGRPGEAERYISGLTDQDSAKLRNDLDVAAYLATAVRTKNPPVAAGWFHPQGDSSGAIVADAADPVLLQRWSHPLTDSPAVQDEIEETEQELREEDRATIPAAIPLAIGDFAVSRTLRGIAVHSVESGRLHWELADENSPEDHFGSGRSRNGVRIQAALRLQAQRWQFGPSPSMNVGDNQPLPNRLYRDGVHGFLTSDGKRIFAVEDSAGSISNKLVAYDLLTGRPAWPEYGSLGGLLDDGPFVAPLAGHRFLGPPVPVGGEAYVIAEKEKEILLIAIDPESGSVLWRQLIANAPAGIDQDPVRQDWPAMPAIAGGVLVCPTTVGWVMGIDQANRSLLWAHRFSSPDEKRPTSEANAASMPTRLNHRWCPSTPIISNGRVVLTPSEEPKLQCLDLYTGELQWQRDKDESLYVAGVFEDRLVMVGTDSVTALELESGRRSWELELTRETGLPAGRAVIAGPNLYLPLEGGTLWQIDLKTGMLASSKRQRPGEPALGNLVLHRGTLLSYSTDGVTAFEERNDLIRRAEARLRDDPGDVVALLLRAELQHCDGDPKSAAGTLDLIDPDKVAAEHDSEFRKLRWDVWEELAKSDDGTRESLTRLQSIAETPEQSLIVRRLEADRASAEGDVERAAEAYLSLMDDVAVDTVVSEEDGRRQVRLQEWLAGRFADLWSDVDENSRDLLGRLIGETLKKADPSEQPALVQIFAFHPAAVELSVQLARQSRDAGRYNEAEVPLLKLARSREPEVAESAHRELAELSEQWGLAEDARYWRARADLISQNNAEKNDAKATGESSEPAESGSSADSGSSEENPAADGTDGSKDNVDTAKAEDDLRQDAETDPTAEESADEPSRSRWDAWGDFRLSVVRAGGYTSSEAPEEIVPDGNNLPFYRDHRLQLMARKNHLAVSGPAGAGLQALIPIRSEVRSSRHFLAMADGHLMFLLHGGAIQAISPPEGRVLWSTSLDDHNVSSSRSNSQEAMRPAGGLTPRRSLVATARARRSMPVASASYVAVMERGEFEVRDPLNGKVRWSRDDLPRDATVVGTDNYVYVLARDADRRVAYRATDGSRVSIGRAAEIFPQAVAVLGDRVLTVVAEEPSFRILNLAIGRRSVVALRDPRTGEVHWQRPFPEQTLFDLGADGRLYALAPDGEVSALDPETGTLTKLGAILGGALRTRNDAYLLTDAESVYVIVNSGSGSSFFAADMPVVPVGGSIFAFDRNGAGFRWKQDVQNQRLLCQAFDHLPVLLLIDSDRQRKGGQELWQVDLLAIDKRTGQRVLDEPYFTTSTPYFHDLTVDSDARTIELTAYHTRLRLQATTTPRPGEDGPSKTEAAGDESD